MSQEEILGRVHVITSLADYQDGSIVSRALLNKEGGSVTLFAFDQGQELSEHTTPHDALVLLIDGEAEIRIGGTPHRLKQGEVLLLPAGIPHAVKATARFRMLLAMLRS